MPREILTTWVTPAGGGRVSVMFFDEAISVATQRNALDTFWKAVDNTLDGNVTWNVETTGREVDSATGTLTGIWADATTKAGAGLLAGDPVPDASQALMRWTTDIIINGRFVQGRTFLPGVSEDFITNGNFNAAGQSIVNTAITGLLAAGTGFSIWHRPVGGAGGFSAPVTGGSAWSEFAVLRRRRS